MKKINYKKKKKSIKAIGQVWKLRWGNVVPKYIHYYPVMFVADSQKEMSEKIKTFIPYLEKALKAYRKVHPRKYNQIFEYSEEYLKDRKK